MKLYEFPNNFLWGGASWATGYEGARYVDGKSKDSWDIYYEKSPEKFFNKIGPDDTIDLYNNYEKYIDLMKKAGYNSFRFSISWSRFIDFETGEKNEKGVQFYDNMINYCLKKNIEPIVCLSHFDLPAHLEENGGWLNGQTSDDFCDYALKVFDHYNNKINIYFVFNEVAVVPEQGYLNGVFLPLHKNVYEMVQCAYNMLLAQAKVIKIFRDEDISGKIGTILNPNPVYSRGSTEGDLKAANYADLLFERPYLEASIRGEFSEELISFYKEYNLLPDISEKDKEIFAGNTVDLVGINYYSPKRVKESIIRYKEDGSVDPMSLFEDYELPGREFNFSRGWEIYPKGIYDMLIKIKNEYHNIECMITENGMGIEKEENYIENDMVNDDYRISFYTRHLYYIHKAISEGSNCIGFHMWSPFDNWSPLNTFKNRYGLYRYDIDTHEMKAKKSRDWFLNLATTNVLEVKE